MALADSEGGTLLTYDVTANVGGKLAQLGSRLIDGFAKKMADSFFDNFRTAVEPPEAAPATAEAPAAQGARLVRPDDRPQGVGRRLRPAIRSATSPAIAASPSAASPSATPRRSAAGRFWLTFHLPTSDATAISIPTMPRICAATNGSGASRDRPGLGAARLHRAVSASICARSQAGVLDHRRPAARLDASRSSRSAPPCRSPAWSRTSSA